MKYFRESLEHKKAIKEYSRMFQEKNKQKRSYWNTSKKVWDKSKASENYSGVFSKPKEIIEEYCRVISK